MRYSFKHAGWASFVAKHQDGVQDKLGCIWRVMKQMYPHPFCFSDITASIMTMMLFSPAAIYAQACRRDANTGCTSAGSVCSPVTSGTGQSGHCTTPAGFPEGERSCECAGTPIPPTNHAIQFDTESAAWKGAIDLGNSALQLAVGQASDGALEIFFAGTDYGLYHIQQTSTNGTTFNGWAGLGLLTGSGAQQVAAIGTGPQYIFYIARNGSLFSKQQLYKNTNDWSDELPFKGDSARQVTVAKNMDGRLEIFYVGTNGGLYHNWQEGNGGYWAGETRFGLRIGFPGDLEPEDSAKQIAVAQNTDGRLEIFYVGTNSDLYHNAQAAASNSTAWTGERQLSGAQTKQVAVGQNADGRLQVFYVGTNNDLYTNWQVKPNSQSWVGERRLSAGPARQIAVGRNRNLELEVFYVGTNSALYHNKQTAFNASTWTGDARIENQDLATQVAVANTADGSLAIFYILYILPTPPAGK